MIAHLIPPWQSMRIEHWKIPHSIEIRGRTLDLASCALRKWDQPSCISLCPLTFSIHPTETSFSDEWESPCHLNFAWYICGVILAWKLSHNLRRESAVSLMPRPTASNELLSLPSMKSLVSVMRRQSFRRWACPSMLLTGTSCDKCDQIMHETAIHASRAKKNTTSDWIHYLLNCGNPWQWVTICLGLLCDIILAINTLRFKTIGC